MSEDKLWRVEIEYVDGDAIFDVTKEIQYVRAANELDVVSQYEWCTSLFVTQASVAETQAYDVGYEDGWDGNEAYKIAKERLDSYDGTAKRIVEFFDETGNPVFEDVFTCGVCRGTFFDMSLVSGKRIPVEGYKTPWNVCKSCSDIVDAVNE